MAVLADDTFAQLEQHQRRTAMAMANTDPALSARLGAYHDAFWWMDPGAKWSLAKAGIDVTDPAAQAAAHAAAHIEVNAGLGFAPVGSPVTKPSTAPDVSKILAGLDQQQQQRYTSAASSSQYVAPSTGPLRQLFTDDAWNQLNPQIQQALNNLQVDKAQPGERYANQGLSASDVAKLTESDTKQPPYKLVGWTNLDPALRQQLAPVIAKAIGAGDTPMGQGHQYIGSDAYLSPDDGFLSAGAQTGFGAAIERNAGQLGILEPLAPIMRPAFMVASAPFQEVVGQFRNVYELATQHDNPNWLQSQSDLGVAAGDLLHGRRVDLGTGVFVDPTSEVGQERERRLRQRGLIAGHGITPGRALANVVFEPGSKPYQLLSGLTDMGFALKADPSIKALKVTSEIRAGNKLIAAEGSVQAAVRAYHQSGEITPALQAFSEAGGLTGIRPTISADAAEHWLTAPKQAPMLDALAGETDPYKVYRALGRQADPAVAVALAEASTPQDVANVLRGELGTTIREKFSANDVLSAKVNTPSRWVSMMPDHSVDASNLQANVRALERVGSLVKAPDAQLGQWFDAMARTTLPEQRLSVWEQAMDDTAERLVGKGVPLERAKTLTRLWQESQSVDRVYAVRAVGEGAGGFDQQLVLDGLPAITQDNKPTMLAQTLDGQIPLPDWRALRKSLSVARPFLENTSVQGAEHLLMRAQGTVWKALQISTVKTMIKVLGDEQLAISGRGYNSLLNHPVDALAIILATPLSELPEDANFLSRLQAVSAKKVRWAVEEALPHPKQALVTALRERSLAAGAGELLGTEARMTATVTGHNFETLHEVQQVATHGFDAMTDDLGVLNARDWKVLHQLPGTNDTEFLKAHGRHLAQHAASPEMSAFARADTLTQAQEWYWDGPLKELRLRLSKIGKDGRPELLTREGSDAYVAKSLGQMNAVANGNPELMEAIGSGELKGTRIWTGARDGTPTVNKSFLDKLKNYREDFPVATPQQKQIYSADMARRQVADGIFGRAIHTLLGTPSAILSKSPLFRQAYWERIVDNAPFMSAEAQNATLKAAGEANVGNKVMDELIGAIKRSPGPKNELASVLPEDAAVGQPALYHGSSSKITEMGDKFSSGSGADNLFGPGFYTTDSEGVAGKYVAKGRGQEPTVYSVKWTGEQPPEMIDLESALPTRARRVIDLHIQSMLHSDYLDFAQETADKLAVLAGDKAATGASIYSTIRKAYGEAGLAKYEVDESLADLSDRLEGAGYDGFTHQGGMRVGRGKELHGVRVFFDPEKLQVSELATHPVAPSGALTLQQADDIAKGHGLDMVRRTTHEFSQRSQAFDMLRLLTPFGEVWRKTIQRWANIVDENPQVVRRFQQGWDVAHSPDLGAFMGNPAGQGFFHTGANGEEVFSIPGSEWATQALTGVPVPLVGNVKGLSLGTEFFPALGPVASIPVAYTMQKLHLENTDLGPLGTLGEVLFPYGPPKEISDAWNYAPSWMKNALGRNRATSPDSVRTFNNSIIDYVRYGISNGDYDTSTPEGIQHAVEDATDKAHKLSWIRGATQFFVPGAPAPQMLVRDKSGKLMDAALMVQDYKKLQDEDPNTAGQKFLDQYGPGIFTAMTSKSYAYVFGIPTSADSAKWVDDHASIKRDLPHIFGYFAPPSDPNQFDYETYKSQLEPGGGRAALSPEQWAKLGNSRLAALQYGHLRDKVDAANGGKPADANQRAWLAMKKQELIDRYPGYADSLYGGSGLPSRPDAKLLALEAAKAVNDPTVQSTDAGKGLSTYLNFQQQVDQQWVAQGFAAGSWQMANGEWAIQLRTWLRSKGMSIQTQHPQFGPLFEDVFDRAMKTDTDPNNLTAGG